MAEELLDRVLREVCKRKLRAQAAVEESRQLEAALEALGTENAGRSQPRRSSSPRVRRRPISERAPREQTRTAVLEVIAERPGVSAGARLGGGAPPLRSSPHPVHELPERPTAPRPRARGRLPAPSLRT